MSTGPRDRQREELLTPIQFVKGVGPQRAELLDKLGIRTAADAIFLFPRRYEDYSQLRKIDELNEDEPASVQGVVDDVDQSNTSTGKHITYLLIRQEVDGKKSHLRATWFNQSFMFRKFQPGQRLVLQGKPRFSGGRWEMVHPRVTFLGTEDEPNKDQILPVYRLTEGLNQFRMRQLVETCVEQYASFVEDVFPESFLSEHDICGIQQAIRWIHAPDSMEQMEKARLRLVYQELFVLQAALAMRRFRVRDLSRAPEIEMDARIHARILRRFPFELTASQKEAVDEIAKDMSNRSPMNRLLQGEVGSGKTVVAFFAALLAVANGYQATIMAPTEILARQHARTINGFLKSSRVKTEVWTGALTASQRNDISQQVAEGKIDILIGTQAIIQSKIEFKNLAVAIVDEQHKFGVKQRAKLRQAGVDPHYLVMTATPIPRTIAMTAFGDLDVSTLKSEESKRGEVHTYMGENHDREKWWEFFRKKLREGRQGFIVAPLVDAGSSETQSGYASAEQLFESVTNGPLADFRVDMVHGRQSADEKDAAIQSFVRGNTQVLIATTVIEVGIDVPNATLMTIESAERFGLSQLHQLRGRVGRGGLPGYVCVFANVENEWTQKRIQAFVDCNDGFELAEQDLLLRGPGNLFSGQQHGMPPMRIADLVRDLKLLERTREDAQRLIDKDPNLDESAFAALRKMVIVRYGASLDLSDVG